MDGYIVVVVVVVVIVIVIVIDRSRVGMRSFSVSDRTDRRYDTDGRG